MSMCQSVYYTMHGYTTMKEYNIHVCVDIYRDPETVIQTSSNEAYAVTKTALSEEETYEYVSECIIPCMGIIGYDGGTICCFKECVLYLHLQRS